MKEFLTPEWKVVCSNHVRGSKPFPVFLFLSTKLLQIISSLRKYWSTYTIFFLLLLTFSTQHNVNQIEDDGTNLYSVFGNRFGTLRISFLAEFLNNLYSYAVCC